MIKIDVSSENEVICMFTEGGMFLWMRCVAAVIVPSRLKQLQSEKRSRWSLEPLLSKLIFALL